MKAFSILLCALLLSGCAAPGAPTLRTNTADGEGPLIPGCQNVSSTERVEDYITAFYLTTWGSVWAEGTVQQVIGGFSSPELASRMFDRGTRKPAPSENRVFNNLTFSP